VRLAFIITPLLLCHTTARLLLLLFRVTLLLLAGQLRERDCCFAAASAANHYSACLQQKDLQRDDFGRTSWQLAARSGTRERLLLLTLRCYTAGHTVYLQQWLRPAVEHQSGATCGCYTVEPAQILCGRYKISWLKQLIQSLRCLRWPGRVHTYEDHIHAAYLYA